MTELLNENYTKTFELHVHYSLTVNILVLDARQSKTKYFFECVCTTVFFNNLDCAPKKLITWSNSAFSSKPCICKFDFLCKNMAVYQKQWWHTEIKLSIVN